MTFSSDKVTPTLGILMLLLSAPATAWNGGASEGQYSYPGPVGGDDHTRAAPGSSWGAPGNASTNTQYGQPPGSYRWNPEGGQYPIPTQPGSVPPAMRPHPEGYGKVPGGEPRYWDPRASSGPGEFQSHNGGGDRGFYPGGPSSEPPGGYRFRDLPERRPVPSEGKYSFRPDAAYGSVGERPNGMPQWLFPSNGPPPVFRPLNKKPERRQPPEQPVPTFPKDLEGYYPPDIDLDYVAPDDPFSLPWSYRSRQ